MDKIDKLGVQVSGLRVDFGSLEDRFDSLEKKMEKRFDKVMTALVDIAGQFKKFDEERVILSDHSRDQGNRIEKLEKKVFKVVQI